MSDQRNGDQRVSETARQGERQRVRTFRDLIAWQRAMELGVLVYEVTRAMPQDERFGLTRQIRDAVASVASNIAEGHGRGTRRDYIRVLRTARGSLWEVSTELELAIRTGMLRPDPQLDDLISETGRVLQALIRALERKEREGHV